MTIRPRIALAAAATVLATGWLAAQGEVRLTGAGAAAGLPPHRPGARGGRDGPPGPAEALMEDQRSIGACMELLLVSRNLERVADLATNVAEDVVFVAEGRTIKHHAEDGLHADVDT